MHNVTQTPMFDQLLINRRSVDSTNVLEAISVCRFRIIIILVSTYLKMSLYLFWIVMLSGLAFVRNVAK